MSHSCYGVREYLAVVSRLHGDALEGSAGYSWGIPVHRNPPVA